MKSYRNWKVRIYYHYFLRRTFFLAFHWKNKTKNCLLFWIKETWFATFWQKNWNIIIAAASDLSVMKCLIQFLQNRCLVNYLLCLLRVVVSTFKKSEVNPVKMEIYYEALSVNSEWWIHSIVFPVWKSLSKSGKKCIVLNANV